ncbi:MAG: hypothetical protein K9L70_06545 [Thiohalocapsa sp.]|nr:hypothetical protein [Thiohalocapsa sp.]
MTSHRHAPATAATRGLTRFFATALAGAMLQVVPAAVLGCGDPALHPGRAEYDAAVAALRDQPPSRVQLRYRLEGDRRVGKAHRLRLWFWSPDGAPTGHYKVMPSSGLVSLHDASQGSIPDSGKLDVSLRPRRPGFHFVQIETRTPSQVAAAPHRTVIPIAVELDAEHRATKASAEAGGLSPNLARAPGFAGPRGALLMQAVGGTASESPDVGSAPLE